MSITPAGLGGDVLVSEDALSIVMRANELGFSPWRVGIALRLAPMELAWICAHLNEQTAHQQILDHNGSPREFTVAG